MFTFKSNNSENCDQKKRGSHDRGQSSNSSSAFTIKLNRTPSQKGTASAFKKGILKNSGNNAIKLRPCESTETSSCYESASSDAESSSSCLTGKLRNEETHYSSNSRNSNSGRNRSYGFNRTVLFVVVTAELLRTDAQWVRKFGYLVIYAGKKLGSDKNARTFLQPFLLADVNCLTYQGIYKLCLN